MVQAVEDINGTFDIYILKYRRILSLHIIMNTMVIIDSKGTLHLLSAMPQT